MYFIQAINLYSKFDDDNKVIIRNTEMNIKATLILDVFKMPQANEMLK